MPVFKRKSKLTGRVSYGYDFCIGNVRYREIVKSARTKPDAQRAEDIKRREIFQGIYGKPPSDITLKEFVKTVYIPWAKEAKRSWRNDQSRIKPILAFFRRRLMREITSFDVERFKHERLKTPARRGGKGAATPRAPASVDRELQLLSRIFTLAISKGEIFSNPCSGVKLFNIANTIIKYLTPEQEEQLLPFLTGRRKHLLNILTISLHTGMRRTELLSLHKDQVDLVGSWLHLTHTKNNKPRLVPIHEDIYRLLVTLCEKAGKHGYLFENPKTGRPIREIKTAWREALRLAGIPYIPFHCAGRHTFGTRAAEGGATVADIKEIMDHADIKTTMRYVHATDQGKRRAVEAAVKIGKREAKSIQSVTNPSQMRKRRK